MKKIYYSLLLILVFSANSFAQTCELSDLQLTVSNCNQDKKFFVEIDFKHANTSECFIVKGGGHNYGTFKYIDLPITIGPLAGDCTTNYEFVLFDCNNERCRLDTVLGKKCCETKDCLIEDLRIEKGECNSEGNFFVSLNFNHHNTSDCFNVNGNGVHYGTFNYANLPIKIGPLKGNCETNYGFVVRDCVKELCAADIGLGVVCCESSDTCEMSHLVFEKTKCDSNNQVYIYFKFNHSGGSDSFNVKGNGTSYGTFAYSQLPVKVGPVNADCSTHYEFIFRDKNNEHCAIDTTIEKICCEQQGDCELGDIRWEKSECKEGQFYISLNFDHARTSDCFRVKGNGHDYGEFSYANLPIKIGPLKGDCTTEYEFVVVDCKNEHCSSSVQVGKVCCEQQGDCDLGDIRWEKSECKEGQFYISLNFNHTNTSDCFRVKGNGHDYGEFSYANLPIKIGPLKGDCTTEYEFVVVDCKNEHCSSSVQVGKVCCEQQGDCKLGDIKWERTDCKEGQFYIYLKFDHNNTSDCFRVKGNGHDYGEFSYANLPIKIGPLKGDCTTEYEFVVLDCKNEHCSSSVQVGKVCCEQQGDCKLGDIKWERTDCKEGQFYIYLKFDHANTSDCFRVKGNGHEYGEFSYANLPIKIGPLKGDFTTEYEFVVVDCKNERCNSSVQVGKVCCEQQGDCKLGDIKWEKSDCKEGQFYITLSFDHSNTSDCFRVKGNGHDYGEFSYANLPIKIGPLKGDCTTEYEFVVVDCKNERCNSSVQVGKVCCEQQGDCKIGEIHWERTDCKEGQFYIYLKFDHDNTSDCFRVRGNGHDYGEFSYANLPIKIGPLKGDCTTEYEFVVVDCKNERCNSSVQVGKVCCEQQGDCKLYELEVKPSDCNDHKQFYVTINFLFKNTSDSFDITGNGKNYGRFAFAKLPIKLGPFEGDCTTNYEFVITDYKNKLCKVGKSLGKICCNKEETCEIYELLATPIECTGQGQYSLRIDFKHKGTKGVGFDVYDRNGSIGFYPYSSLPLTIPNFKRSGNTYDFIKICENDNERCCKAIEFKPLICFTTTPGGFSLGEIIPTQGLSSGEVLIQSNVSFPETFQFKIYDVKGSHIPVEVLSRDAHVIRISSKEWKEGVYILHTNYDNKNKYFKILK
ncbi:MAG: T9SS type A sorting domain-containing protein [Saprospiraceae bacterium]|uniref:T9SS type A sorting domain-containing protein n=1 Tax=Candidatus Defluviibacterium haderslevense TaxID=2981993 RepID=A0A9D7XJA4_9BACT|nr:T9SS type A sorting domain-containing protein [Candidatus Defluviibacterium haderslevense]